MDANTATIIGCKLHVNITVSCEECLAALEIAARHDDPINPSVMLGPTLIADLIAELRRLRGAASVCRDCDGLGFIGDHLAAMKCTTCDGTGIVKP